jgi:hypothetical protein
MLVAIHQPEHLPWLGFFEKMVRADLFVILDDVQFSRGDFQNRNRVKGSTNVQWLTVPVVRRFPSRINEVEIASGDWRKKHWKTVTTCYARSPYFKEFAWAFEDFYRHAWTNLAELNVAAIKLLAGFFGVNTEVVYSSQLRTNGKKSDLVLDICKQVGATRYYAGQASHAYLNPALFRQAGIEIVTRNFVHPTYRQLFMKRQGFVPNLSVLDLLFNCGGRGLELLGITGKQLAAHSS